MAEVAAEAVAVSAKAGGLSPPDRGDAATRRPRTAFIHPLSGADSERRGGRDHAGALRAADESCDAPLRAANCPRNRPWFAAGVGSGVRSHCGRVPGEISSRRVMIEEWPIRR